LELLLRRASPYFVFAFESRSLFRFDLDVAQKVNFFPMRATKLISFASGLTLNLRSLLLISEFLDQPTIFREVLKITPNSRMGWCARAFDESPLRYSSFEDVDVASWLI
jgi:hypothetical protein